MANPFAVGLFWQDVSQRRGQNRERGPIPEIIDNGWRPPSEFPNLSGAKVIGLDTETYDPELTKSGPGWARGKGHIIGASLSVEDGTSWYFPIRHGIEGDKQVLPPEHAAMNMDPEQVLRYLRHTLGDNRPKVGANLIYDIGWLAEEGVDVGGRMYDIQFAEALLDSEAPDVTLDGLAKRYLNIGKTTEALYEWLANWCGGAVNDKQRKNLYLSPPCLAGPYAESDAALPIQVLGQQWGAMSARGVLDLFDLECRSIPLLVKMRQKGAPINLNKCEQVYDDFTVRMEALETRMQDISGGNVNPNASDSMKAAFKRLGLPLPTKTDKKSGEEKVSFDKDRLGGVDHPLAATVLEYKKLAKVRDTFIKSYLMDKQVNGRVYCSFHPLKGDGGGTRSGRFSSSDPNLQNIPVRSEEGKLVRSCFDGTIFGNRWRSFDYSSIEYRLLAHFAVGGGADEVRAIYAKDPTADYHTIVKDMILQLTSIALERSAVKGVNFGIIYGMALAALAQTLGLSPKKAKELLDNYHKAAPYVRATMDMCAKEVHDTGMVRTILNRASDFNVWGKKGYNEEGRIGLPYAAACRKWGMYNIERQYTHKALNRKLQGSAADVMKVAMIEAYEGGLFDEAACGIPCLTVHDELDFEDKGDLDNPAWDELRRVMESALSDKLRVPLLVEGDVGPTWRDAH